jgi:hypothetical protein
MLYLLPESSSVQTIVAGLLQAVPVLCVVNRSPMLTGLNLKLDLTPSLLPA